MHHQREVILRPVRGSAARKRQERLAAIVLSPSLLVIALVLVVPLLYAAWLSLHEVGARFAPDSPFVGLENYLNVLRSGEFIASAGRTLYFVGVSFLVQFPLGMAVAVLLNQRFRGRNLLRAVVLIPWAIPTIVNGALWTWIYQTNYGALNGLLLQLGVIDRPVLWLGSPQLAMNMVIVADTWKVLPFYVVLFLAGLQTIPDEVYQAAQVDGANVLQKFLYVTLPALKPVLLVVLVLRTMDTFRVFDIVYQITQGGPAGGTTVVAYQAYLSTFLKLQFGYGSAVSFVIAAAVLVLALLYFRALSEQDE